MRHARLRLAVSPLPGSRGDSVPSAAAGGTRRVQLCPVDLRPPPQVLQPERQLMAAVLVDAVATWRRDCRPRNALAERRLAEIVGWLQDPEASWPFSFLRICAELDLDAAHIRRALR